MINISQDIQIPLEQIRFTFVRSSGPGGQNVNKVASKAVLRWNPTESGRLPQPVLERMQKLYPSAWTKEGEIVLSSQRTRDALRNRETCLEKLRAMILKSLKEPKRRIPTKPTKGSIRRRLEDKAINARKKEGRKPVE